MALTYRISSIIEQVAMQLSGYYRAPVVHDNEGTSPHDLIPVNNNPCFVRSEISIKLSRGSVPIPADIQVIQKRDSNVLDRSEASGFLR